MGIDDFAYKKGKDYMGVVVGQMTPIALLEDRSGEALDNWLIWNPQIQYMMRDRGRCFTESINRIIPGVTQISSNQEYDGYDDTGNRENNSSDQVKAQI